MKSGKMLWLAVAAVVLLCAGGGVRCRAAGAEGYLYKAEKPLSFWCVNTNLKTCDLKFTTTKREKAFLSYEICCKNGSDPLAYSVKNGVLYIRESGLQRASRGYLKKKYGEKWFMYWPSVTVHLPAGSPAKNSVIRLNEGDLSVGKNVCCENTDVDMKYGDVHFSAAQVSGKTDIYTKEGDVMAAGLRVAGNMQIRTGCGDISAVGVKITGNMKIRSGEGNVCVMTDKKNCRLLRVAASTKYGDMRIAGGKRKRKGKGIGWVYKKSGSGKPGLQIATKYGDVLLFRKNT